MNNIQTALTYLPTKVTIAVLREEDKPRWALYNLMIFPNCAQMGYSHGTRPSPDAQMLGFDVLLPAAAAGKCFFAAVALKLFFG